MADAAAKHPAADVTRAPMQEWTRFPLYLSQSVWNTLASGDSQLRKVDEICSYLIGLGLRHASERTSATVAALVSHMDGENLLEGGQVGRQVAMLSTVKSTLKTHQIRARQLGKPIPGGYLIELPSSIDQLPVELRQQFFQHGLVTPPIDLNAVWTVANAWPMRATNRLRQLGSVHTMLDLQQGHAAAIATQAAVATAQSLLAIVNPVPEVNLPGFQQFQPGNRINRDVHRRDDALRSMLDQASTASSGNAACSPVLSSLNAPQQLALTNGEAADAGAEILSLGVAAPAVPAASVLHATSVEASRKDVAAALAPAAQPAGMEVSPKTVVASGSADAALVERSLAALANAHYDETLPSAVQPSEEPRMCKRPAAMRVMKKPAAAAAAKAEASAGKKSFKKPAAAVAATQPTAIAAKKKPATKKAITKKKITRKEAYKLKPAGCARCRHQRGCCPSCWLKKGIVLVD